MYAIRSYYEIIREIADAGGVRKWDPGEYDLNNDWQRMFWHWLKQCSDGEIQLPSIYLGYGTEEDFATAHGLLGDILSYNFV